MILTYVWIAIRERFFQKGKLENKIYLDTVMFFYKRIIFPPKGLVLENYSEKGMLKRTEDNCKKPEKKPIKFQETVIYTIT